MWQMSLFSVNVQELADLHQRSFEVRERAQQACERSRELVDRVWTVTAFAKRACADAKRRTWGVTAPEPVPIRP